MGTKKNILIWSLRVIISALFLLSAVAKSFPIWAFEKQIVDLGITDWCLAPYLARLIIALETAIAIAILQPHYLRSIVIPLTIGLLVIFCTHLGIQMYQSGAMNGNCGCFGQLIPMTPLEAFIKNIVTIAILFYLFKQVKDKDNGENRFINLLFIYTLSALIMFFFFPFAPCKKESVSKNPVIINSEDSTGADSSVSTIDTDTTTAIGISSSGKTDALASGKDSAMPAVKPPAPVQSKFSGFTEFSGKKYNLDKGQKVVCLFVPGCDHCRHTAKELVTLSKKVKLPPIHIIFMNEELFKLPDFFKETGANYPYHVMEDIPGFFTLLGNGATTPGVFYLWNGNIIKAYEGTGDHQFNVKDFKAALESNQTVADKNHWW